MKSKLQMVVFFSVFLILTVGLTWSVAAEINVNLDIDENGNIIKIMDDVEVSEDQEIDGDLVAIMGDVNVKGKINGDLVAILGDIHLDNVVTGDVVSVLGKITNGPGAEIRGETTAVNIGNFRFWKFWSWNLKFYNLLILYGLVVLVYSLFPSNEREMAASIEKKPLRNLLVGLISVLVLPVVFFLFVLTIVGIPFVPLLILTLAVISFIGYVAVVYLVGKRVKEVGNIKFNIYLQLLVGVLILWILNMIPVFGIFAYLLIKFLAIGVVLDTKFGTNNPWFKKGEVKE